MSLPDGLDWLMKPVLNGLCSYESLKNGVIDLEDILNMNNALEVKEENESRANEVKE